MSAAVTGPMPSIVSSCSTVARAEADRAVFGGRRRREPTRHPGRARHDDLLAVGEARGEVDRFQRRIAAGAARPLDRVGRPARPPAAGRRRGGAPRRSRRRRRPGPPPLEAEAAARPPRRSDAARAAAGGVAAPPSPRIARAPTSSRATATAP